MPLPSLFGIPGERTALTQMSLLTYDGTLTVLAGSIRIYNKLGKTCVIRQVFLSVGTAPTGAAIIVDVNVNGLTIFANQAHRPQILVSTFTGFSKLIDKPVWREGDYMTMDVDVIGSTIAGANLTAHIIYN